MATITKIKWEDANFKWNDAKGDTNYLNETGHLQYTWNEVFLVVQEVVDAIEGGAGIVDAFSNLEKKKKKRFVELIMYYKGTKVFDGRKDINDDFEVSAKDVGMVIKEVLDIDIIAENIHV